MPFGPRSRTGPTRRSRTSRGAPATPLRAALGALSDDVEEVLVLSGDVPLVAGGPAVLAARAARPRPRGDRPGLGRRPGSDRSRPGRPQRRRHGRADRRGQGRDRRASAQIAEINAGLYAIDAAWLRRRIGDLPTVVDDRRAVPDRPRRVRPRGRAASWPRSTLDDDGRLTGINDRAQLAEAEWDMRAQHQRAPHARRRDDARPVHGLRRPDGRARPGRRARAERHAARHDIGGRADARSRRVPDLSTRRSAATASSGRA